jgi:hypothetical protein
MDVSQLRRLVCGIRIISVGLRTTATKISARWAFRASNHISSPFAFHPSPKLLFNVLFLLYVLKDTEFYY